MADVRMSTRTICMREYALPSGTTMGELLKANPIALKHYRDFHGLDESHPLVDDALTVEVRDDDIVIQWSTSVAEPAEPGLG